MDRDNLPAPVNGQAAPPAEVPPPGVPRRFDFADADFAEEEGTGSAGLKRMLGAVLYYRWLVIGLLLVGTAAGIAVSRFVEPEYTARTRLWVSVATRESDFEGPIQSAELLQGGAWLELLASDAVLDHVVREQRLYLEYRTRDRDVLSTLKTDSVYQPGSYVATVDGAGRMVELRREHDGQLVAQAPVGMPVGREIGIDWHPTAAALTPGRSIVFRLLHPRTAAARLSQSLDAQMASGGNFLFIAYSGGHPEQVSQVTNELADRYVDVAAELKRGKLSELRQILETQLVYAEENLRQAELALESFRIRTITLPSDATPVTPGVEATRASAYDNFFELKIQREALARDRDAIRRLLAENENGTLSIDALSAIGAVQSSPELTQALTELTEQRATLRALQQQYTDEHPLVRSALREADALQREVVPQLAGTVAASLDDQIAAVDALVGSASDELREIPPRAIDESRLTRAVTIAATLYNELRQRYESARLATETAIPDVRILDAASVPQYPSSNPSVQIILLAIVGSLGLGVGLAILLERFDPRIRYPEQVSDRLHLRILGGLPHLQSATRRNGRPDRSEAVEALRSVRLNLTHAYGAAGPMILTISSPGPGDGKSFVSGNLGLSFADLGRRTLLIDGDTRRGTLHRLLGVDRIPGLTDYLAGRAELDEVIKSTSTPGLDLIPCGTRFASAPELLSSPRMGLLLAHIRATYQVILVDSPPLGAGVDPLVLATATGNLMVVIRTGTTDRSMAEDKIAMLGQLPIRVLGAVVNGLRAGSGHRYQQYYSYLPGYAADDEAGERVKLLEPA
ncbi:MAG TPA: polysaccharide biosynthesis tyrosine autokinase [Longimicrobiales bacterium]|nr:polysaccharide biosynthesis tyrosine autokinase [Longimicrobiales bacterium]